MSRERSLTVKVLTAAARDLALAIAELNSRQRRLARVERYFVAIDHDLYAPAQELRPWPGENGILYRFEAQSFTEGWDVASGEATLGYVIKVKRCYSTRKGVAKRVFGAWRRTATRESTLVRLLVVDDGVPALFHDGKRYSGDIKGLCRILHDIGWPNHAP
ncbi:hypothetical protein [Actinomadura keratinilytica]|jgi:hypothetical protein|uniref:Uncharacterized protein n=1 Tax=Actinomadura keratinilytica TaxID=547461 RepID=A0ABP7YFN8_9ACTN